MRIPDNLRRMIDGGRIPHAIIFEGGGADDAARYTAMCAVCGGDKKPCGECAGCVKAKSGNHPDIKYYEPSGTVNPFPVDVIREIRMDAYILPNEADRKVYILSTVDKISPVSQNALLKIFEEPPEYVVFILTCGQKTALLDTILSRAMVFSAQDFESGAAHNEQAAQLAKDIAEAALLDEELTLLRLTSGLIRNKPLLFDTVDELAEIFRGVYRLKCSAESDNETAQKLCGMLTAEKAMSMIDAAEDIKAAAMRNANPTLNMTRFCAKLRAAAGK